jgi:hypothetical protein
MRWAAFGYEVSSDGLDIPHRWGKLYTTSSFCIPTQAPQKVGVLIQLNCECVGPYMLHVYSTTLHQVRGGRVDDLNTHQSECCRVLTDWTRYIDREWVLFWLLIDILLIYGFVSVWTLEKAMEESRSDSWAFGWSMNALPKSGTGCVAEITH